MIGHRRTFGFCAGAAALLAVGGAALVSAQPADGADDRRQEVAAFLLQDGEFDGVRNIRLSRAEDAFGLDYSISVLPGVPVEIFLVERFACGSSGERGIDSGAPMDGAAEIRARLAGYLARCRMTPDATAAVLGDFDRAFQVAIGWASERATEIAAMPPPAELNATDLEAWNTDMAGQDMDMTMDMDATDMDMTTDMNASDMTMDMNAAENMNWSDDSTENPADPE